MECIVCKHTVSWHWNTSVCG